MCAHRKRKRYRTRSSLHFNHSLCQMISTTRRCPFFFRSHSALPSWICYLNQLPLPPLLFFSSTLGYLVVYQRGWKTAGARPAQNTREEIQFGVGSKLCGHLRTARLGVEHGAGWMHIRHWRWLLAETRLWFLPTINKQTIYPWVPDFCLFWFLPPLPRTWYVLLVVEQCGLLIHTSGCISLPGCAAGEAQRQPWKGAMAGSSER